MTIAPPAESDRAEIARICARSLPHDQLADEIPDVMARGERLCLASRGADGRIRGFVYFHLRDTGTGREGVVDAFAVADRARGQGVARALFSAAESEMYARACTTALITGAPPHYAWPGIDVAYTPAIGAVERLGYLRCSAGVSMTLDVAAVAAREPAATRAAAGRAGTVRPATRAELPRLRAWMAARWPAEWAEEVAAAVDGPGAPHSACHLAVVDGEYAGFCAHGVNRRHEIGPFGVPRTHRGRGIGTALMRRCVEDKAAAGLAVAEIVWAGPVAYLARAFGARIGRVFWTYRKELWLP